MDKNKIIEAAAKLVAKGAYDKAIKEYQKILDADPKDVRILQKMGELYQKKNDNAQAAEYFTKVAESYATDGFFLKAVALYKQVLKLNPALIEVNLRLAELHQQLQLIGEAMAYYQLVANHFDKAGDTKSSLDTLKKMVDLDPDNVASRKKLAELYSREGMNGPALSEFKRAAEYHKRNNQTDDYLRVAERICQLDAGNHQLARELAEAYLQKGDQKRALAKLQACFKVDPRDIETLKLLATAFQGLGQISKTVSVYKELAKIYAEKGRNDEANQVWRQVEQLDPSDPDLQARRPASAPARPAPAAPAPVAAPAPRAPAPAPRPAPAPAPAAPAAVVPAAPASLGREQLAKLLTETDVYVKYGLHDKALEHLRKIFTVEPENLDAHEKAYNIYVASNNHAQAAEQLLNVLRLCTRRQDTERAGPYLETILRQNPGHPEVPAFLAVLRPAGAAGAPAEDDSMGEEAILVDASDEEIVVADEPEDALAAAAEDLERTSSGPRAPARQATYDLDAGGTDEPLGSPPLQDEPLESPPARAAAGYAQDEEPVEELSSSELVVEDEPATGEHEVDLAAYHHDGVGLGDEPDMPTVTQPVARPGMRRAPTIPENVVEDPALEAAYADVEGTGRDEEVVDDQDAVPPVEEELAAEESPLQDDAVMDEAAYAEPEPEQQEETLVADDSGYEVEPPAPLDDVEAVAPDAEPVQASPTEEPVEAPPEEEPASEECDEASFFLDQGLFEEAREILETVLIAYPGHRRAAQLLSQLEQAAAGQEGAAEVAPPAADDIAQTTSDAFDLAAQLAEEFAPAEEPASALPDGDDFQYSVEEVFSEFKKGLEKVVKPEDVDTHYDLGIAYKEMGLIDDAVGEFTVARQGCRGKRKEVDCLTMTGMLQGSRGDWAAAIDAFREALKSEHAVGELEKALRYELGAAYESAGEAGKALFQFQKVSQADGKYRDVAACVERLAASATPEDDRSSSSSDGPKRGGSAGGPPAPGASSRTDGPKTRKVGYV